jgi:cytosine/adenosine deaminase-related metal-dependent hydrolase
LIRYHARWILPIERPPLRDGWVLVDRGRIVATGGHPVSRAGGGPPAQRVLPPADRVVDLGEVVVLPGLVNAHTHLELSYLSQAVPPAAEFVSWIRQVMASRAKWTDPRAPLILDGVRKAVADSLAAGTAVVGDISNTLVTFEPLAESDLAGVVFYELIRFNAPDPEALVQRALEALDVLPTSERVRLSLAAHAPYSVAPALFHSLSRAVVGRGCGPWSVHLSESRAEVDFIRRGEGPWRELLHEVGAWDQQWRPPAVSPVEFLDAAGLLDEWTLAVHGVQMTRTDLDRLRRRRTPLVTCPRSNEHTGAGNPPLEDFYASGVAIAVGTDSLASAPDLSVFSELAAMRRLAPGVPASKLLESATLHGARALRFEADYGSIAANKLARLLAVTLPPATDDVEEYLVSGVRADQVRWIGNQRIEHA